METKSFTTTTCTKTGNYYDDYPDKKIENQSIINLNYAYMKKVITLLIPLLILGGISFNSIGQTVYTIGSGTATNASSSQPTGYMHYWGNGKTQLIYQASELTAAGMTAGWITQIGFNVTATNGCTNMSNYRFYAGLTTTGAFPSTAFLTTPALVYQTATYNPVAGINTHTLTTPFQWDGTSNILIQISTDITTYNSNASMAYTTFADNRYLYYQSDGTAAFGQTSGTTSTMRSNIRFTWQLTPPVLNPATFTATAANPTTINLAWTKNASSNNVMVVASTTNSFTVPTATTPYVAGATIGTGTVIYNGAATSYVHTPLSPATTYYYMAYSVTAANYYSGGASANATTPCVTLGLPYSFGFGATNPCWLVQQVAGTGNWGITTAMSYPTMNPYEGGYMAIFSAFSYSSGTQSRLITPVFTFAGAIHPRVEFYMSHDPGYAGYNESIQVQVSTDGGTVWTNVGTPILRYDLNTYWGKHMINLDAYAGASSIKIGFLGTSFYGNNFAMDAVSVYELAAPSCVTTFSPSNLSTTQPRNGSLTWTSPPMAETYDVYFGTTNPPAFIGNVSTASFTPPLMTPGQVYYWKVVPTNVIGSATGCPVWSFTASELYVYCATGSSYINYEDITNVTLGTLNNSSTCTSATGYTDFRGTVAAPSIRKGFTYPISVTAQTCDYSSWAGYFDAYIDWNHDGSFDVSTEKVTVGIGTTSIYTPFTVTANVAVPMTALVGVTTMRVIYSSFSYSGPCGLFSYGEAEDYKINVLPYDKDLSVKRSIAPVSKCSMSNSEIVTVEIENKGEVAQNDYYVSYYNGISWITPEHVTTTINPGEVKSYTFATHANFSAVGEHICKFSVALAGDLKTSNDTLKNIPIRNLPVIAISDDGDLPYTQNFDGTDSYWYSYGANNDWALGTPAKTFINGAASGTKAWVTKTTGNYSASQESYVESPCFDMSLNVNPMIQMDVKYRSEAHNDGARVLSSIDGGLTWNPVGNLYDATNWYNDTTNLGNPVWAGQSSGTGYVTVIHRLIGLGGKSSVKLRVYFHSNSNTFVDEGFAFDNVKIYENPALFGSCPNVNIEGVAGDTLDLFIKGGQPQIIAGKKTYHVRWSPSIGLSCNVNECGTSCIPTQCQKPIATPPVTTMYTAKIWDYSTGSSVDTIYVYATVFVYPELQANADYDATVCDTANTQIYAHVVGGKAPYTYHWNNAATLSSTSIYNPVAHPYSTTTYTVTVTDALGFTDVDNVTITVVSGYATVDIHPNAATVCKATTATLSDSIQLTATGGYYYSWTSYPPGQYISNPNIANPYVRATVSNAKFTCTVSGSCGVASDFVLIGIIPKPVVTLASFSPSYYCIDHAPFALSGGLPLGGTYSGNGVNNGMFNPDLAGTGNQVITYSYIAPNGCLSSDSKTILVRALPGPSLSFVPAGYCINHAPVTLTGGSPTGGVYSGGFITAGVFNVTAAGVGSHLVTYTYTDPFGCSNSADASLLVYALPTVTLLTGNANYANICIDAAPLTLTGGLPVGGVYTGTGVSGGIFTPSTAGTFTITYTYTDVNGCVSAASKTIKVMPKATLTGAFASTTLCRGESTSYTFTLTGTAPWTVTWKAKGISQTSIVAGVTGSTSPFNYTLTLTPNDSTAYEITSVTDATNCTRALSILWNVNINPLPFSGYQVVMNDPNGHYCVNTGGIAIGLNGSENGVTYYLYRNSVVVDTFAGPGTAFWFEPNQVLAGVYTVKGKSNRAPTYCMSNMSGSQTIVVDVLKDSLFAETNTICVGGTTILHAILKNAQISTGPYDFNWSPLADLSPNGYGSVLAHPTVSKYIHVTIYDPTGCTAIDSMYITVNTPPVVSINSGATSITVCDGLGATLSATSVFGSGSSIASYNWSPAAGLSSASVASPIATPSSPTTYHVTVTDNHGCEGYAQISVIVRASPNVEFAGGNTAGICPGGSVTIPLNAPTIGTGPFTYAWAPSAGLSSTSIKNPVATPAVTTVYTVTVTDVTSGCYRVGTFTVTVNTPPVVSLGTTYNICNGSTANLNAMVSGGHVPYNFVWAASPSVVSPAVIPGTQNPSVIPQPNSNTSFTVTVTDNFGCSAVSAPLVVTTGNTPVAHAGPNDTICQGEGTMLTASGGGIYQWFVAGGAAITTASSYPSTPVLFPSVTTTYEVRVTSACGVAISFVTVLVYPATTVSLSMPVSTFCNGAAAVTVTGFPTDLHGVFSGNGIADHGNGTATFTPSVTGTYNISYTYTNASGCSYTATHSVTVNALPVVSSFAPMAVCQDVASVVLTGGTPAGGTYSGVGVTGGTFYPAVAGLGAKTVTYTYTNANGCTSNATSTVTVNKIPDAFSVTVDNNGHYCNYIPAPGVHIRLSNSEFFVASYRLILDGTYTGISMVGTGTIIDFGVQTATGVYTVQAVYNASGCTKMMNNSVTVVIDPLPLVYTVSGGGSYCSAGSGASGLGVDINLDNSNLGVTYHLYRNGYVMVPDESLPGVNGLLTFQNVTLAGTYTVMAVNNSTGCQKLMSGSAAVVVLPLPNKYFVSFQGGGQTLTVCQGTQVVIRQNFSEFGVTYELYFNGNPTGLTRNYLQGPALTWSSTTFAAGVYTVVGTRNNAPYYCYNTMNSSATLAYYVPVSIVTPPANAYLDEGQAASFSVTAGGSNAAIQWQISTNGGSTWTNLANGGIYSGVTTSVLNLTACPYSMTRYQYRAVVSGPCNTVNSPAGVLSIDPIVNVYAGNVSSCVSSDILVPLTFTHADSINAISLTIYYDNTNFTYTNYINLNSQLSPLQLSVYASGNRIGISYFDVSNTVNSNYGTFHFLDLRFNGLNAGGTCHALNFDLVAQGACELSKLNGDVLTTNFFNGQACVVALPTIVSAYQSPTPICADETLNLFANATHPEGVSYSWTGPNGFVSNLQNPVIANAQVVNSGVYTLTVTSLGHQCVSTTTVNAIVHPRPNIFSVILPGGNSTCAGSGVEVALSGSDLGTSYRLYKDGAAVAAPDGIATGTGSTITFGPQAVSGTYEVLATNIYGCTNWMTGNPTIHINPLPLWFNVQGGGHYCIGGNGREIRLSGSQIGVQYTLLLNACCCQADSIVMTVSGTGSPISFGYHTLPGYYSVVSSNPTTGCTNNMIGCIPIIIDPLPTTVLTGVHSVCYGSCSTIHFQSTGKSPWQIVVSNGTSNFTVTASTASFNYSVCPTATTTYTVVSVTDGNGCTNTGSGSATITIWALPVVSIANSSPVCIGGNVTITSTVTGNGPFTYLWTGPNGFTSSVANPVLNGVTLANAGTYTLQITDLNGCVNTGSTTVVVNPLPVVTAGGSSACIGSTLTLHAYAAGTGPFNYSWTGPNGFTSAIANPVLASAALVDAGVYSVTVTDANGCVASATATLAVWSLPVVTSASNTPVCVHETINLTASATGFGIINYNWSGPNAFTATGATASIANATAVNAGVYSVNVVDEHQCSSGTTTTVVVNPLPEVCYITGGGVYCFGCIPPAIGLACSSTGISYELLRDGNPTGVIVAGTGNAISFGGVQLSGLYTVIATNVVTGCASMMGGTATVVEQAPPTATIDNGTICAGQTANLNIHLTGDSYWAVHINNGTTNSVLNVNSGVTGVTTFDYNYSVTPSVTTTYTISLVTDAVCYNTGNAGTVTVNPNPTKFQVNGGGYFCSGIGVYVGMNGSQAGVNYQLFRQGTPSPIATVAGTGSAISFGPQTTGIYTVVAVNATTGCTSTMNGDAVVIPDPGMNGYNVSGGGRYCVGGSGVCVYVSGSQTGVEYKLLLNNIYTGTTLAGTGSVLSFCGVTAAGDYTVIAFNPQTTCTRNMTGTATVVVDPLPTATISGSATVCYGLSATLHVTLTGTAPWNIVVNDGFNSFSHHILTSNWDTIVTPGNTRTYTISTVVDAHCQNSGSGSATITVNSPSSFVVTGGGSYCAGGQGVIVGLSGSQVGTIYTLYIGSTATSQVLAGTGSPLSFGYQTVAGTYTVVAHDNGTGCNRVMNGTSIVVITPLPTVFNVTGGGACCLGCTHVFVCLSGSQTGISYEIYINNVASGIIKYGNGQPFCYDYSTTGGTYTIKATNMQTGCWTWMNGSATVVIYPTAQAMLSGNSTICAGDSALLTVNFSIGTAPYSFGLSNGSSTVTHSGITTNPYSFYVKPVVTSVYTLAWVSDFYGCYNNVTNGSAIVSVTQIPGVSIPQYAAVCVNAAPFVLTGGLPAGGSYKVDGVAATSFNPATAGLGSHAIAYQYTNGTGCQGFAYSSIVVNPLPAVSFTGLNPEYCIDAQMSLLVGNHAPLGSFSGQGVIDNNNGTAYFNPQLSGIGGPYTITYSFTDGNGCSSSVSHTTSVGAIPNVFFSGLSATYCVNEPIVTLTANMAGGVFSGPGVVGNTFNPAAAGVGGPYMVTYTYSNGLCANSYSQYVTVYGIPDACTFNAPNPICCTGCFVDLILNCSSQGINYQLYKFYAGTTLPISVQGAVAGNGLPIVWSVADSGFYWVVATNPISGCSNIMTGTVNVITKGWPEMTVTATPTTVCVGQQSTISLDITGVPPFSFTIYNGSSLLQVNNLLTNTYDLTVSPSVTTTYTFGELHDAFCFNPGYENVIISVNPAPAVYNVTGGGVTCQFGNGVAVGLDGSQAGVYYQLMLDGNATGVVEVGTGSAISFGTYSVAGTYTVESVSLTTCEYVMNGSAVITVTPLPQVSLSPFTSVCEGSAAFALSGGSPAGGVYFVNGIQINQFDPAGVGVGTFTITYEYTNGYGCANSATQNITVDALPYVTLASFSGVCFGSSPIVLGGGLPAGGSYYVNGTLATTFNPTTYGAGTYSVVYMYQDANGCSGQASRSITVYGAPVVSLAQFANTFCLGAGSLTLTGGYPAGGVYSGQFVTGGQFNATVAGDYQITYSYTDQNGCSGFATQTIHAAVCAQYGISGTVAYDNTAGSVMNNVSVNLMQGSALVATTTTDNSGHYNFGSLTPGSYTVRAASSKPWGGVNSADALLILKHFAGISTLAPFRALAANVNADAAVNSIDALMAAKRFVNQISSFPAGDWLFQANTVVLGSSNVINNFSALCFGDVNGSYTPPYVKTPATVSLNTLGVKEIKSYESFLLPVNVTGSLKVGAISMVVFYPENLVDVEGVVVNNGNSSDVLYTANNGELRISWYSMKEITLSNMDALLTLNLKTKNISGVAAGELALTLDGVSEISDKSAAAIQNVNLTYPKLVVAANEYSISNYPNPFKGVTEIVYNLPEDGKVTLTVYNILGDQVAVLVNNVDQNANTYKVKFDGSSLVPGVYTYKMEVKGATKDYVKSTMMVLTK